MYQTRLSKRVQPNQKQTEALQTPIEEKHSIQRPLVGRREPLYTQLWGNQVPPWLRLSVPGQTLPEAEQEPLAPVQRQANTTGLPDALKAGVESLSGLSLDNVQVHYNSSKPADVQALAYTQGTQVHVGPGQEKHLAHEAWHVVQQKLGRVVPTQRTKGVAINDDQELEREADILGEQAGQMKLVPQMKETKTGMSDTLKSGRAYHSLARESETRDSHNHAESAPFAGPPLSTSPLQLTKKQEKETAEESETGAPIEQEEEKVIGPALPPGFQEKVIGPALPPDFQKEEEEKKKPLKSKQESLYHPYSRSATQNARNQPTQHRESDIKNKLSQADYSAISSTDTDIQSLISALRNQTVGIAKDLHQDGHFTISLGSGFHLYVSNPDAPQWRVTKRTKGLYGSGNKLASIPIRHR